MTQAHGVEHYSVATRVLHWLTVLLVVILFPLGLWMRGLSYYSQWYQTAPMIHISIGLILLLVLALRLGNRALGRFPGPMPGHAPFEKLLARLAHIALYLLLLTMVVTGYLLAGIEGQGVSFFDWFRLPGVEFDSSAVEDSLEEIHELAAWTLVGLASLHAMAALKHQFWDKDSTLKRMVH